MCVAASGVSAPIEIHVLDKNVYWRTRMCTNVYVRASALCDQGLNLTYSEFIFPSDTVSNISVQKCFTATKPAAKQREYKCRPFSAIP